MKKKILFVFRNDALKEILATGRGPKEFLYGMDQLDTNLYEVSWINAPQGKRRGIRRLTWFLEFPFNQITKLGLPLEIYPLFKKEIRQADIIFCNNDPISLAILFWKWLGRIDARALVIFQSLPERLKYFRWNWPVRWLIKKLLGQADLIFTLSQFVQEDFIQDWQLDSNKVKTFYFGIDMDFWHPSPASTSNNKPIRLLGHMAQADNDGFILSIGNDMNRDYQTLVDALPENEELVIITRRKNLNLRGKKVKILSGLTDEQVRDYYWQAKLVVVPSIKIKNESSGLSSILQALTCGKPVITSDAPPLIEQLGIRPDVFFYPAENSTTLKEVITSVLSNLEKIQARESLNYTTKEMALTLMRYLCSL